MTVQFSVPSSGREPSGFKEISRGVERSDTPDLRPLLNSTLRRATCRPVDSGMDSVP